MYSYTSVTASNGIGNVTSQDYNTTYPRAQPPYSNVTNKPWHNVHLNPLTIKLFRFDKMEVNFFQIVTFMSRFIFDIFKMWCLIC